MTVYIDSLFLTNFFMDSVIISITAIMRRKKLKTKRILTASTLSALYGTLIFFPDLSFLYSSIMKLIFSFIPVIVAFKASTIKDVFISWAFFIFITAATGGIIFLISSFNEFGNIMHTMVSNCVMYMNISPLILFAGSVVLYTFMEVYRRGCIKNFMNSDMIVNFSFLYMGEWYAATGLIDTGCELREPLTNAPCIILERSVMGNTPVSGNKLKIKTVAGEETVDFILPETFECTDKEIAWDCVVVLCDRHLSDSGRYNALINPDGICCYKNKTFEGCRNEI